MRFKLAARRALRATVPWWAKGAVKLALARVPLDYPALRAISLARHGGMEDPAWALDTFLRHFDRADFANKRGGFSVLELGPGDSLFTALIARAMGARETWLVDVGRCASGDLRLYRRMVELLRARGLHPPDISDARSVDDVLRACGANYATGGIESLRTLPDRSFDFIFSNAVLQCVRREQVLHTLSELRRLLRAGGCSVHSIDLRDMLGRSLHHLRFSERAWECDGVRRSGFYTNRLRLSEWCELGSRAGFETVVDEVNRWPQLPLPRPTLAGPYGQMATEDLCVATIRLVLR